MSGIFKRVLAVFLCFIVIANMMNMVIFAEGAITFGMDNASGSLTDEVTTKIKLANNTGFASFTIDIIYDKNYLAPVSVIKKSTGDEIYDSKGLISNLNYASNKIRIVYAASENTYFNGDIFEVKFKIIAVPNGNGDTQAHIDVVFLDDENWRDGTLTSSAVANTGTINIKALTGIFAVPNKIEYIEGQYFDTNGLVVTANYNNGDTKLLTANEYTLGGNLLPLEIGKDVTVTYTEKTITKTAQMGLSVRQKQAVSISLETGNVIKKYIEDTLFDPTGLIVKLNYDNGSNIILQASDYILKGYNLPLTLDNANVLVEYKQNANMKASFDITVDKKILQALTVTSMPSKIYYKIGEAFSTANMAVMGHYNNNKDYYVTDYSVEGYNKDLWGDKKITIKQAGIVTNGFNVKVIMSGDVTYNGIVEPNDAVALLRHIAGLNNPVLEEYRIIAADVYGIENGVDPNDAVSILRKCVGDNINFK